MQHIFREKKQSAMLGDRIYRVTRVDLTTKKEWDLHAKIIKLRAMGPDFVTAFMAAVRELNSIAKIKTVETHNLLPTAGRTAVAQHLTNSSPSPATLRANYVALGSSATAPVNANTTLGAEVYRNPTASATNSNNIAYITGFFSATETNGTYAEVGLFIAGTAAANSGTLFSRALLAVVKSSVQTLTVDYIITIN